MKNILILSHLTILLMLFCSTDLSIGPGLQSMEEIPSSVSRPVLRVTLPASWDENWFASPAVYDLDNDGSNEIIASRHSVLYVWGADNKLKWRAPAGENGSSANDHGSRRMYCSPVVGDLDHDGFGEIAVAYGNQVAVYDHQGNLEAGWPQSFPGSGDEIRSLAAGDLDNDNRYEICVVKTSKGPVTNIWRIDGTVLSGWPQLQDRTARNDYGGYNQNIGIADLDGDGMNDIVSTYDICHIGIMRSDGSEFTASGFFKGKYASSVPMFHDIALAALKKALEEYSERNLESIMETTNRAIKQFVGFGQENPDLPKIAKDGDLPKKERLEIRVHQQLKKMILNLQKKIENSTGVKTNISTIVLSAIILYIRYSDKLVKE